VSRLYLKIIQYIPEDHLFGSFQKKIKVVEMMSDKKKLKNKGTIIKKLEALGMKIAQEDDPMYKIHSSIHFISKRTLKKNGEGSE
jgi:hypothetical protein